MFFGIGGECFYSILPMLPIHLLVQNLLYDVSQIAIPFDHVDEEQLKTAALAAF